jgi:transposase
MKKTYSQVWPAYDAAQINETNDFKVLVRDLCAGVVEMAPKSVGRPRLPVSDQLMCMLLKVYSLRSGRRAMGDMKAAYDAGLISRLPHCKSVFRYFALSDLQPYLIQMVIESSRVVANIETAFSIDSTGFSTSRFGLWVDVRFGRSKVTDRRKWLKAHLMCGVLTNIVTAVVVTPANCADSPYLKELLEVTNRNFGIRRVHADKAYSSVENLRLVRDAGGMPFIPFKSNTNPLHGTRDRLWTRLYHFYACNQEWFEQQYHKRSNAESTNAMIKAKFGERLRSRTEVAQYNELLCKIVCHNICVTIQSMYELKIEPRFWRPEREAA